MHLTMTQGMTADLALLLRMLLLALQIVMTPGRPSDVVDRVLWWKWVRKVGLCVRLGCRTPMVI